MPYTPPPGNLVEINFAGEYFAPVGNDVQIAFGNVLDNYIRTKTITFEPFFQTATLTEAELITTHQYVLEPQYGTSVIDPLIHINANHSVFELSFPLLSVQILPDIVNATLTVELEDTLFETGGNEVTDLPSGISPGTSIFYGYEKSSDAFFDAYWIKSEEIDIMMDKFAMPGFLLIDFHIVIPWKVFNEEDISNTLYWDSLSVLDIDVESSWQSFFIEDQFNTTIYSGIQSFDHFITKGYGDSVPCDNYKRNGWDTPNITDVIRYNQWTGIGVSDREHEVPWGPKELFAYCYQSYLPPNADSSIDIYFPSKYPLIAGVSNLNFELSGYSTDPRCETIHNHTGPRDNNVTPGIEVPHPYQPPPFRVKQVYYIMNSVLVQTLPGNVQIEVKALTMTIDRDSWLWQLNMTVGKREYVDLLSPKNGVFVTVQVNINGWKWVFDIEKWSENLGFAKGSYTVSGRSPSLLLGDPICEKKSYTKTAISTGSAIIDEILTGVGSGYSVAFSAYTDNQTGFAPVGSDWTIPADVFSYNDQTDIQAIQTLTESIGGYVQTYRDCYNYGTNDYRILEVLPRYAWQPWNWELSNTDIIFNQIDKSIVREMGSSYVKNPDYYGAYIIGEAPKDGASTGVFCNVYKQDKGTSCVHAPISSSVLYTTDQIAQEKGRMIIGDSGIWVEHSIRLFSLFPSGTSPGLLKVGDMINVTTGATSEWLGLITSTEISAAVTNKSAFSVSQTLGVQQYVGEWL